MKLVQSKGNSVPESRNKGTGLGRLVNDAPGDEICYFCAGEECDWISCNPLSIVSGQRREYNSGVPETRYDIN